MRIITLNVNGIRSAERRGLLRWMAEQEADVVCLQETRAQRDDLGPSVVAPHGYHSFFHSDKKGYS
nr:endonuclease/exonuclease/phosphatase family protein [Gammaproteobacteria bacterium]